MRTSQRSNLTSSYANTATHPSHLFFLRTRQLSHFTHSYANTATQPSLPFLCEHGNAAISPILMRTPQMRTLQRSHLTYLFICEHRNAATLESAGGPGKVRTVPNSGAEQWCRTVRNSSRTARQLLGNCRELCPNCSELFGLSRNLLKV